MKVKLIIGLGNPGKEYEKTYHNVGFLAVDYLIALSSREKRNNPKKIEIATVAYSDLAMAPLLKSDAYMNQSGNFVKTALKKYKAKPDEILIVHDDSDIELGKYKISFGRGSAGHKGVQSIIDTIKTKNFWRLRIGIGQTTNGKQTTTRIKAIDLVLKKINKNDLIIFEKIFKIIQREALLQN
ncbi:MAG: aminoacyl-tRNA hydrolase [Patescibacteria group bacterium]